MSRKQITYTVEDEGRDKGKEFIITEMSAWDAEELSEEIYRAMGHGEFNSLPADVVSMGVAGLATVGVSVLAAAPASVSRPISDRILSTVEIVITNEGKDITRSIKPIDFEEISTIRTLKDKVFELNFGFLSLAAK
ncbi:TPA: hypothetical protein ACTR19_004501 [Yersinia enterocolitica]|uniref:hypothetical protein n=1 Tax=Yersinia enterocolitica TaxID=630 RepID=UPI0005E180F5|nr:hypothetical protein [Yersinia enterocolitica]EKN4811348.1 hypothetical protein [Yersinia enterocolitica]CFQ73985.1 Uncharacterised protein [Yersinia enterocolitica]HDL6691046.1 hypothetical protein [Yersinia enterocolitica]HDL8421821.1 hypothetical protein [Yersinia enterocolitica]HDT6101042.1 hypothetical protein [Yersinia enterocolitica]